MPVDAIGGNHRGIAAGPAAQGRQRGGFAGEIGGPRGQIGADGEGICQRHAAMQTSR